MARWLLRLSFVLAAATAHAVAGCRTCPDFDFGPFMPTAAWQTHAESTAGAGDCAIYAFGLEAGRQYELTTCSPGGGSFDSVIEVLGIDCAVVARNDDCSVSPLVRQSTVRYVATETRTALVKVHGGASAFGPYTLAYRRVACPAGIELAPTLPAAAPTSCSADVVFDVTAADGASVPVRWDWTIIPPAGGFAVPRAGTVTSSAPGGAAQFASRLTGLGAYTVGLQAFNSCGATSAFRIVTLTDATRPTLTPPPSRTVDCAAVPPPEPARVRDNCDPAPVVSMTETVAPGNCPGRRTIRRAYVATDASDNVSAPGVQALRVVDFRAPVLRADATVRQCAYPPDRGIACFVPADFAPSFTEACSLPVSVRFARITSSEDPGCGGPADLEPDAAIAPDGLSACVRAERCNALTGRAYLVEATAIDACGNASPPTAIGTILIPPDGMDTSSCRTPTPGDP